MSISMESYFEYVKKIEPAFRILGEEMLSKQDLAEYSYKTGPYDVLSKADTYTEKRIFEILRSIDPRINIVGEETGNKPSSEKYWLVDPIDGTVHYLRQSPFFTMMVALIVNTKPVLSIIYNPYTDDFFFAIKGEGAYKNNQRIRIKARPLKESLVFIDINLSKKTNLRYFSKLVRKFKHLQLISSGYEYTLIAEGKADASVCLDPYGKAYDFAPGVLLVSEAGGVVKDFQHKDYRINQTSFIVARSPKLYNELRRIRLNRLNLILLSIYEESKQQLILIKKLLTPQRVHKSHVHL